MNYQRPPSRRAPASEPDWLTLGQAAKFLGVAQSTIRKWSDQGRVPAFYTPGGHRRYRRSDLESFLDRSGPGGRSKAGPLVLLVDDDEKVRELVRVNLEFEGYTVCEAGSADEGMSAIAEAKPDLVLLDVMMPHVDGWEMLRRIQDSTVPARFPSSCSAARSTSWGKRRRALWAARRSSASRSNLS